MDSAINAAQTAFRSARLSYIKIDEAHDSIRAFMAEIERDPSIHCMAHQSLFRPQGPKDIDYSTKLLSKSFLAVAIRLLEFEDEKLQATSVQDIAISATDGTNCTGAASEKSVVTTATIIGVMCLGLGGIPAAIMHHRNADLGIVLAATFQNQGYGREAINWMVDWAFRHGAMHTVGVAAYSFNEHAIQTYREVGFQYEGRRRQVLWFDRSWHDVLWFGMTEDDWEKLRGIY